MHVYIYICVSFHTNTRMLFDSDECYVCVVFLKVWFSLGRRAELEYFLSRYFRGMKENDDSRKPGHADKNVPSRQEDHEGATAPFDPEASSASLRKEEDRQQHPPLENEKGKMSRQHHPDLSLHMRTPTCSPSTSLADASSPLLQLPSPALTGANSPSDESGEHQGEGEGGRNAREGKAERRGMEISFSPSPKGVKESEDSLTKIEEKDSPKKGTRKGGREIQEEEEGKEEEEEEEEQEGGDSSAGKKDSQNKTGSKKTKKKDQVKKKDDSEEDVLLHPLLLLRIANCEWRVLREFAPDIAETFKSHVRHFKLKRNPYVHTLQQQIDYKLGKHNGSLSLALGSLLDVGVSISVCLCRSVYAIYLYLFYLSCVWISPPLYDVLEIWRSDPSLQGVSLGTTLITEIPYR